MAVAHPRPASLLLLLAALLYAAAFLVAPAVATGRTGQVAVFWGRNKDEGSLREACESGTYTIAIISFLNVFGHDNYQLDLSGHNVSAVGPDINYCRSKGIFVFLSIGGFGKQYSVPSPKSAIAMADYLWNAYMLGRRSGVDRPFGDAVVNGIDFFIENDTPGNYQDLAFWLSYYNMGYAGSTPVQLTATPGCRYPDKRAEKALNTGLFTRIFVRFYDDRYCAANWEVEWNKWTKAFPSQKIYFGLPASEKKLGYVDPKKNNVIPKVQKASNYGGVMVWNRHLDKRSGYSHYAIQWA